MRHERQGWSSLRTRLVIPARLIEAIQSLHLPLAEGHARYRRDRLAQDARYCTADHGLLQASFIPERPQRELRELTRYRASLVHERAAEVKRVQKVLEGANIKLAAVATDIMGVSGRDMLAALIGGTADAATMAPCARGRMREKIPQLE